MKNLTTEQEKFQWSVDVLVKAFLEGTLMKGNCCACAVGNLVAEACGFKLEVEEREYNHGILRNASWDNDDVMPEWNRVFITASSIEQSQFPLNYKEHAAKQIDATGYTWKQLARVEWAFETAKDGSSDEAEYAGLMAVVDVLAQIHGIDLTTAESAKLLFVKA